MLLKRGNAVWNYTDKVKEHFTNPKNVGTIENADAIGEAGSLVCGDMLKLYLKVDDKGIITDAKFQTFGCGSAVASSSILTEMVIGLHIDEAKKITNKQIAEALGGLPPEKMHCSVMGHEALENAINDYYGIKVEENHTEEKIVCKCFHLSEEDIISAIKKHNIKNIEELSKITQAASGCGQCITDLGRIFDKLNQKKPMSKVQLIIKVNELIENQIANELQKDGGDIELIDVEDYKVMVKLKGSCSMCKNAQLTLKNFVEAILKENIDERIEVIQVNE